MLTKLVELTPQELSQIDWICYQLANDHGLQLERDRVWWAILNDANRDRDYAMEMVDDLGEDKQMLSIFAQSLFQTRPTTHVLTVKETDGVLVILVAAAFTVVGLLIGQTI